MLHLLDKEFESGSMNMFKELEKIMPKEKKHIRMMFQQIENTTMRSKLLKKKKKKKQAEIVELKSTVTGVKKKKKNHLNRLDWQKNELPNSKVSQVRLFSLRKRKKKE